jgi:hypothetical protein
MVIFIFPFVVGNCDVMTLHGIAIALQIVDMKKILSSFYVGILFTIYKIKKQTI